MTRRPTFLASSVWTETPTMVPRDDFLAVDDDVLQEQCVLEMFQRVLLHGDLEAKAQFQQQLGETLHYWIHLHPRGDTACQLENEEAYVERAFERFWQTIAQGDATAFNTFSALVAYLRASLNSVIIDTVRAYECSGRSISIPRDTNNERWDTVQSLLSHPRQQRIASLLFHCALKPREIVQSYPEEFSDVLEIAHLRQEIFLLLRERFLHTS